MAAHEEKAFLGQGWAFPVQLDETGEIALVAHEEDIRQAIRLILGTDLGERLMRPDFGANLRAMIFGPINTTTIALVKHRVEEALITWEPRIDHLSLQITADPLRGRLMIDIHYRVRLTNIFYNLVYPFYLVESKEPS